MKIKFIRLLQLFIICIFSGCQLVSRPVAPKKAIVPKDPIEKSKYFIENNEAKKALNELEPLAVNASTPETYYLMARSYASLGELDNAVIYYEKTLQLQDNYDEAYTLLKEIHRYRQIQLQEEIYILEERQSEFSDTGRGNANEIADNLNQVYNKQTQVYLAQGKAFLLYTNPTSNISDFSELDAELRDVQDFVRERKHGYLSNQKKEKLDDPLYLSVLNMRSDVAKKHIKNLLTQSKIELDKSNVEKSIDLLKDANTQVGRYYEEKNSNIQSLVKDDEIARMSLEISKQLMVVHKKSADIHIKNRQKYQELQQPQEVANQNRDVEENLENLVQLQVVYLLRFEKVPAEKVYNHPTLIPLYQQLLDSLPESDKKGEYHLQIARCYAAEKNHEQALVHAKIAKEELSGYRVDEFLTWLHQKINHKGK